MQQEVFTTGPARDFFICAGYDLVEDSAQVAGITVRSFTPAKLADGRKAALSAAAAAIRTFSELLGPYPYREFDVIATNTNALGVEYPGLTTINQQLYFPDEKPDEGIPNNILLESVIAHETAHQWLYNKIGNDQVNEPWLDESLTQYATYRYYVDQYGSQAAKGYLQDFYSRWDRVNRANIPIGKPVEYYADGSYSAIVYGRGAIFFYELEQKYGISMMDDFFHDYVKKYSWDLVSSQEMKDSLEAACQCDLNQLFMDWVE
jgi:aminopeptidase N